MVALKKNTIEKKVSVHILLHSFTTHLLEQRENLRYIHKLLGHKNLKMTEVYTHVTKNSLQNIGDLIDSFYGNDE